MSKLNHQNKLILHKFPHFLPIHIPIQMYMSSLKLHGALGLLLRWFAHLVVHCTDDTETAQLCWDRCLQLHAWHQTFELSNSVTRWLTLVNGEMKEVRTTMPASANSLATSLIRRMFSSRSSGVNARFLFKPACGNRRNKIYHYVQDPGR